jgi:hypothetical protein
MTKSSRSVEKRSDATILSGSWQYLAVPTGNDESDESPRVIVQTQVFVAAKNVVKVQVSEARSKQLVAPHENAAGAVRDVEPLYAR